jgi:hypothetical protein
MLIRLFGNEGTVYAAITLATAALVVFAATMTGADLTAAFAALSAPRP